MGRGKRNVLYVVCTVLFPLAFSGFVIGFALPVWRGNSTTNEGLWQKCSHVVKDCTRRDFNDEHNWMIGVRVVEIFALVMFVAAAVLVIYENLCTNFKARPVIERLSTGIVSLLAGFGGLAGILVFAGYTEVSKKNGTDDGKEYGWAFALLAAGSSLGILLGIGFFISGCCLEPRLNKKQHTYGKHLNGRTPYLTSNDENYELNAYASRNNTSAAGMPPATDNLPGFAVYNGMLNYPGQRNSLPPLGMTSSEAYPAPSHMNGKGGGLGVGGALPPATQPKNPQYYSLSDDRLLDPSFDLSEGYKFVPSRNRSVGQDNHAYQPRNELAISNTGFRPDEAYARGAGRVDEDPYNRIQRGPPRAGYNDPYGFDRQPGGGGGRVGGGGGSVMEGLYDRTYIARNNAGASAAPPARDSYYRRF